MSRMVMAPFVRRGGDGIKLAFLDWRENRTMQVDMLEEVDRKAAELGGRC